MIKVLMIIVIGCLFIACDRGTLENKVPNSNFGSESVKNETEKAITTTRTPESEKINDAPTLTPVLRNYYKALKNKDEKALEQVLSSDTLKIFRNDMKKEGKDSLIDYITETETIPEEPYEVRNEQIQGNQAIAEIRGGSYLVWTKFLFVKENGEWKITNKSPEFGEKKVRD